MVPQLEYRAALRAARAMSAVRLTTGEQVPKK
jgi:hypothetical protein